MASDAQSASAAWRANELRRRVENRRMAAQSLLATNQSTEYDWALPSTSATESTPTLRSVLSPLPSPASLSHSSVNTTAPRASQEAPFMISISTPSLGLSTSTPLSSSPSSYARNSTGSLSPSLSLPQLYETKQEVLAAHLDVVDMQAKQAAALRACDQQFQVERSVRQLESGISSTQLAIREKKDVLDALQRRVLRLSQTLHAQGPAAEQHFASNRLEQLDSIRKHQHALKTCSSCGHAFVPHVLVMHEAACAERCARVEQHHVTSGSTATPVASTPSGNQRADVAREHQHSPRAVASSTHPADTVPRTSATDTKPVKLAALPRFVSQPPRNLRVAAAATSVTHNAILLQWDPPIFTGSTPIFDYEVRFSRCATASKQLYNSDVAATRVMEPLPPRTTSHWCLAEPIAVNAYWLRGLDADTAYSDLTLCAITRHGTSAPSNVVELVQTAPARPPTAPTLLCASAVTATSITLTWHAPFDDGGAAIECYEVVFSEAVMQDTATDRDTFLDVSEIVYRKHRVRTAASHTTSNAVPTTLTLVDVLSGKEHKDFHVRAINGAGIPSDFSAPITSIFTVAPGSAFTLLDELQAAVQSHARVVDSTFLSGFMQRYDRRAYIHQVARCIVSRHPELANKVDAIVQGTDVSPVDNDDSNTKAGVAEAASTASDNDSNARPLSASNTMQQQFDALSEDEQRRERRKQFHFRIATLIQRLDDAAYNVEWSQRRRVDLVALVRAAETRILDKQAELARAKLFRGPQMDSDVLESGLQRFYTKDLVLALEDEIAIEQLYIVDAKSESVQVENILQSDERKRDALTQQLADRRTALDAFERGVSVRYTRASSTAVASIVQRLRQRVLFRAFAAFVEHRAAAIVRRNKVRATLARVLTYRTRAAFRHWVDVVRNVLRRIDCDRENGSSTSSSYGVGSLGLVNASLERDDLVLQSHALLLQLRSTNDDLKRLAWTREQQQQQSSAVDSHAGKSTTDAIDALQQAPRDRKRLHALVLEADAKMVIDDVDAARRLYEQAMQIATASASAPHSQVLALQLKLGRTHVLLQHYERALAVLNRASFLAARLGARSDEGTALHLLGQTHAALRSQRLAIEHYERALLCLEATSDTSGQLACLRGLEAVFATLRDVEMVTRYRTQADDLEFALAHKLTSASHALAALQQRLVGAGAESSLEVVLERVGAIVPRLRTQRIQRKLEIAEDAKRVTSLTTLLADKQALLAQGERDLQRALASDASQVDSSVISGASARYELEAFKAKLAKLLGSVRVGEAHITREIANATTRMRNSEDEIRDLEQELQVETGDLMRSMRTRTPLRCFRFNALNTALQCVVGTASHGVSTCVATSDLSAGLYDLLTGACLSQAVGDPLRQHLGPPTGHQGHIVALYYVGARIYTGGMDAALGVWDVQEDATSGSAAITLVRLLQEFDSAVVSVVADNELVVCGCADCDVFVFDATTLAVVARVVAAHDRSVLALAVDSTQQLFLTGSADTRVRVWELGPRSVQTTYRRVTMRQSLGSDLRHDTIVAGAHTHAVTCIQQVASEIVSGDADGRIVVWHLDAAHASKLLRSCHVHAGVAIQCLQFDATRIVSGALDGRICVTDIATGQLLQTLLGHAASVLDLQLDRQRLVSMSIDGRVRLWYWQSRLSAGTGGAQKKFHILGAGETLRALSLKYRVSTRELLAWNGLADATKLYVGQKLVVGVVTAHSAAADELATLDTAASRVVGKLSTENVAFAAANALKRVDAASQRAQRNQALLARAYFPPLEDNDDDNNNNAVNAPGSSSSTDAACDRKVDTDGGTIYSNADDNDEAVDVDTDAPDDDATAGN